MYKWFGQSASIAVITLLLLCSALVGCDGNNSRGVAYGKEMPRTLNVIALDRSGSTEAMRDAQTDALRAAYYQAAKWGEEVSIYVVDCKSACVLSPTRAKRGQLLSPSVLRELQTPPKARATRTRPALFWEMMAEEFAGRADGRPVRVAYLTDGGNDWYGEEARVSKAAGKLAENPNVSVALLGLDKDAYDATKKQFAPFGDDRAVYGIGGDRGTLVKGVTELRAMGWDDDRRRYGDERYRPPAGPPGRGRGVGGRVHRGGGVR